MNKPQKKGVMISAAQPQISPAYQNAIAITAQHYKTILSSCGASEFFTQDIEEMTGGVK